MKKRAFTIIELLIVMAIIGVLATIIFGQYQAVRARARDAQRIRDLDNIKYALISFKQDNGSYPTNLSELTPKYISSTPKDPKNTTPFVYGYLLSGNNVTLSATLEEGENTKMDNVYKGSPECNANSKIYCINFN